MSAKIKLAVLAALVLASIAVIIKFPANLGLDLQGGTQLVLEAKEAPGQTVDDDALLGVISVIRNRIDGLGLSEPVIQRKGKRQVVVELAGIKDPNRARAMIGDTAQLEFVLATWAPSSVNDLDPEKIKLLAGDDARIATYTMKNRDGSVARELPIFLSKTVLTGKDLVGAFPSTNPDTGQPVVNLEFNSEGTTKFRDVTSQNIGRPLAIVLDGTIISAPNINTAIPNGKAVIEGNFEIWEMQDLVVKLKAGALPVPVQVVSEKFVGPSLGKDSIEYSKKAAAVAFVLVIAFMIGIYRLPGILSSIALVIFVLFLIAAIKLIGATLTLPGIAGIILTIGMAVDANVLIFERIREEHLAGLPIETTIEEGFNRAFNTIVDANLTTIISAVVLFWLGTGTIKGFAVTLTLGVVISMVTAITITRLFMDLVIPYYKKYPRLLSSGVGRR